jgi:hypothetical protein
LPFKKKELRTGGRRKIPVILRPLQGYAVRQMADDEEEDK